jgi:pimeloyl-ACP methyl ester carboxylesterase
VRQPEVVHLTALVLALLFVVPVARAGWSALLAGAFLLEFLTHGRSPALSALTAAPTRQPFPVPGAGVDLYVRAGLIPGGALVLVHGLSADGKDDPRVQEAAGLLSRAGFDVAVPTIPGLTRGRLGQEDVEPVVATLAARPVSSIVVGVSVGAGPALLAAADPRVRERVSAVLSLGGYASATEVVRFWLTGAYGYESIRGRVDHDPEVVRMFVRANAERLDATARAILEGTDREAVARLLSAPPPDLGRYLDSLSPLRAARDIRARLVLVHGRADRAVPYTESLRLAAARPERTTLVLVGVVDHVKGGETSGWRAARDFLALWRVMYAMPSGAQAPAAGRS